MPKLKIVRWTLIFMAASAICVATGSIAHGGDTLFSVTATGNGDPAGSFLPATAAASSDETLRITKEELELIRQGKATLLSEELVPSGEERKAVAVGIIEAPIAYILQVLFDFDSYLELFPELEECVVVKRLEDRAWIIANQVFNHWPKKKFYTHLVRGAEDGLSWRLVTSEDIKPFEGEPGYDEMKEYVRRSQDDFRINRGAWKFVPLADDPASVMAVYTITMRLQGAVMGSSLATRILNSLSRDNMPGVINKVKQEAEGRLAAAPAPGRDEKPVTE